jgi:hypothetical protein
MKLGEIVVQARKGWMHLQIELALVNDLDREARRWLLRAHEENT